MPPYENSPSFPSGHTLNTTVVIALVVYLACLQIKRTSARVGLITAGVIFIVAMGLSRVFLGHHWMTDVIVGWLLGLAWVGIVILAHRLFHVLRHREHAGPAPTFDHPAHLHDGSRRRRGTPAAGRRRRYAAARGTVLSVRVIVLTHAHSRRGPPAGRP